MLNTMETDKIVVKRSLFNVKSLVLIAISILLSFFLYFFLPAEPEVKKGLALFLFIGILWFTEALPLAITAILIPLLAALMGIMTVSEGLSNFSNPIIFLFLGGFALAAALHKHGVDDAIAHFIISFSGQRFILTAILLFSTTAFLSMWISNTATAAIMLPLVLGLLDNLEEHSDPNLAVFLLLGTAYSASLGGLATIIGSPPNAIASSILGLTFIDWFKVGFPTALILLLLLWGVLLLTLKPNFSLKFKSDIKRPPFKFTPVRITILVIFSLAVVGWILGKPISEALGISRDFDTIVALSVIVLLGVTGTITWKDIEKNTAWGILILFGGGLTLSALLESTGASGYLADILALHLFGVSAWLIVLASLTFVVFFTELVSNTASGALLIPLFMILAESVGLSPYSMAIAVAMAASCAFMLPVATPPNAIVFSSGHIQQRQMIKVGLVLNIACVLALMFIVMAIS